MYKDPKYIWETWGEGYDTIYRGCKYDPYIEVWGPRYTLPSKQKRDIPGMILIGNIILGNILVWSYILYDCFVKSH